MPFQALLTSQNLTLEPSNRKPSWQAWKEGEKREREEKEVDACGCSIGSSQSVWADVELVKFEEKITFLIVLIQTMACVML